MHGWLARQMDSVNSLWENVQNLLTKLKGQYSEYLCCGTRCAVILFCYCVEDALCIFFSNLIV